MVFYVANDVNEYLLVTVTCIVISCNLSLSAIGHACVKTAGMSSLLY